MADPSFFNKSSSITLGEIASICSAELSPGTSSGQAISDVAPLDGAGPGEISFLDNKKYIDAFSRSRAGACIVHPSHADRAPDGMALVITEQPYRGYAKVAQAFYPFAIQPTPVCAGRGIDPTAKIGKGAVIDPDASVGPNASIGAGTQIGFGAVIGHGVKIGDNCMVGPGTTIQFTHMGDGCIIHPGARIGQDGFGFAPGGPPEGHIKLPQLGRVIIGNNVEIGANTTVDRGAGPDTVIGDGSKIDNLVQIGHNVRIGQGCFIAAMAGISGSTTIGNFVMIGGQSGFAGHITIGDGAQIAAQSGVMRDVEPGGRVVGVPAVADRQFFRQVAALAKLAKTKKGE